MILFVLFRNCLFSVFFWLGLWKNEYFVFLYVYIRANLLETNHWLMFSNSWFIIRNKYLIFLVIVSRLVFSFSWIWMNFLLFESRLLILRLWFLSIIPYSSNFLRRIAWSTVSKAFDRSVNTPSAYLLFSKDSVIWSTNCTTAWSVE